MRVNSAICRPDDADDILAEFRVPIMFDPPQHGDSSCVATATVRRWSWGLAILLTIALVAFVYGYGLLGGDWVERVSQSRGEVLAQRAKALTAAGETEAAVDTYRKALDAPFDDPRQVRWTRLGLGRLLHDTGAFGEAAAVFRACADEHPDDLIAWSACCGALAAAEQFVDLGETAARYETAAEGQDNAAHRALAKYYQGLAQERQGHADAALELYLAGQAIEPEGPNAYHAAVLLHARGEDGRAAALLERYMPHASGWRLAAANRLRAEIGGVR